jgi:hypothetical protein
LPRALLQEHRPVVPFLERISHCNSPFPPPAYVCTAAEFTRIRLLKDLSITCQDQVSCRPITKHLLPSSCGLGVHGRMATYLMSSSIAVRDIRMQFCLRDRLTSLSFGLQC